MKTKLMTILIALSALLFVGCDEDDEILDPAPAAPQGVHSVTSDGAVYLYWNGPYEADLREYVVLRSFEEFDNYVEIATVDALSNPDLDLITYEYIDDDIVNGQTYFYAVMTVDRSGQTSDLSAETVEDTPRPEGVVILVTIDVKPDSSGFHFELQQVLNASLADVFLTGFDSLFFLEARSINTDIQDLGYTVDIDSVDVSPRDGWSNYFDVEIIEGHTYAIWTDDDHFAKMRANTVGSTRVIFEWAYQTDQGNTQLKPRADQ
jgi:hypothetical protein